MKMWQYTHDWNEENRKYSYDKHYANIYDFVGTWKIIAIAK